MAGKKDSECVETPDGSETALLYKSPPPKKNILETK
jgi:hypothetical protein